jgi:hypothetical protein
MSYNDSEKHCFFVVCEVILIENLRSANSGLQNPHNLQFIALIFAQSAWQHITWWLDVSVTKWAFFLMICVVYIELDGWSIVLFPIELVSFLIALLREWNDNIA